MESSEHEEDDFHKDKIHKPGPAAFGNLDESHKKVLSVLIRLRDIDSNCRFFLKINRPS